MKRHLLTLGIALSLGLNANAALLELKNKANWDTIIAGASDSAYFGNAMAVGDFNGDKIPDLAVGAKKEDSPRGILDTGAVSVFFGGTNFQTLKNLSTETTAAHSLNNASATFFGGENEYVGDVLASGDLDGDGFDDLIIAAQKNANYTTNKIYIIYGGSGLTTNMSTNNAQAVLKPSSMYVTEMATGDLNSDGIADLAINDSYNNKVYIVYGSKTRKTGTIDLSTASDSIISRSKNTTIKIDSLAIGDLNGDGKKDIAISVPKEAGTISGLTNAGKVFVYLGTGTNLPKTIDLDTAMNLTIYGGFKEEQLGSSLASNSGNALTFGDVNGDGIADLVIGSSQAWYEGLSSSTGAGKVQVIFGKTTLPSSIDLGEQFDMKMTIGSTGLKGYLGVDVKVADLNGDGIGDIIMSAPDARNSSGTNGWVFVVYGKKNIASKTTIDVEKNADLLIQNPDPVHNLASSRYGTTLAIADFDNDGKPDLVGGALEGDYTGGIVKGYALMISNPVGKTSTSTTPVASATLEQINGRLVVTIPSVKVVNYLGNLVVSFKLFVDLPNITLDPTSVVMSGVAESSNPAILDLGTNPFELRIPLLIFGSDKYMVNLKVSSDFTTFTIATIEPR